MVNMEQRNRSRIDVNTTVDFTTPVKFFGSNAPNVFNQNKQDMKMMYTNADSLLNKLPELQVVLDETKPDVLAVTEILPKNASTPPREVEYQIPGYNQMFTNLRIAKEV